MLTALTIFSAIGIQGSILPRQRPETAVLTYHDVIERRDDRALWFDCTGAELESQLSWMQKKGVHFVSLDQLYRHLTTGTKLPSHPVAITFADNYLGFWERGYPILKQHRIPVTMFVHTGFVGDRSHGRPKMDWSQLRTLDHEGLVTVASQTVSHPADLGKLSESQIRWEFERSKAELEKRLGHKILYLAYPNGRFNPLCERLAREAGYRMAFSEKTERAELSPNIWAVNRYVHTKYRLAIGR